MTDETRTSEAEAAVEGQAAEETGAEAPAEGQAVAEGKVKEERAPQVVAQVAAQERPREAVRRSPASESRRREHSSRGHRSERGSDERGSYSRASGPANFNRAKQGNQRRNPRHVGNDVRIDEIDYKNVQVLSRFVDNYGRIHNRRKTRVTAKMQRKVTRAIKRARHLALMPYTGEHMRITGRRG